MARYNADESDVEEELQAVEHEEAEGDLSTEIDMGVDVTSSSAHLTAVLPADSAPATGSRQAPGLNQNTGTDAAGTDTNGATLTGATPARPQSTDDANPPGSTNTTGAVHGRASGSTSDVQRSGSQGPSHPVGPDTMAAMHRQLTSAIMTGLEYTRAGQTIEELQSTVDLLSTRLMAANAAREKAEAALRDAANQRQASEEQLRSSYELRLAEVGRDYEEQLASRSREIARLTAELGRLKDNGAKSKVLTRSMAEVTLTGDELANLRRDVEEQEILIKGYQAENEAASRRIKELEAQLKEATTLHIPVAMQRDTHNVSSLKASKQEAAQRLSELLSLQTQLESTREQASIKESELRGQIEKLRAEKRELEARKGGVDLKQMQEGDALVKQVTAEMEAMRAQYQSVITELQGKLRWYVENQELLTKNDQLVREQAALILQLEERLAAAEGPAGRGQAQRIRELQAQVASLNQALKSRVPPNSLAAIVEAAKPSPEEQAAVQALQKQVASLTAQLARKDEEYEVQLRTLQQQYEQLRARYEERQARLENAAKMKRREKELAAQVEDQRAMYTRKIKDLEARLKQAMAGQPLGAAPSKPPPEDLVPMGVLRQKEQELRKVQGDLERTTKQVAELHLRLGELEAAALRSSVSSRQAQQPHHQYLHGSPIHGGNSYAPQPAESPAVEGANGSGVRRSNQSTTGAEWAVQAELLQLRQQCSSLQAEVSFLRNQLVEAQQKAAALDSRPQRDQERKESEAHRQRADAAELALQAAQRAHTEMAKQIGDMQTEHQRALLRMHDEVVYKESVKWEERLSAAQAEARQARQRAEQLESEVVSLQSKLRSNSVPQVADFALLEHKIDMMVQEQAARDARWRSVLDETRELYSVEASLIERKAAAALAAKQAEIEGFRAQVEELTQMTRQLLRNGGGGSGS